MIYDGFDIKINDNGDIEFDGDINIAVGSTSFKQNIKNRILTNKGELRLHKRIGTNLDLLEGMPNTPETAKIGIDDISDSLLHDEVLNKYSISIKCAPISKNELLYMIISDIEEVTGEKTRVIQNVSRIL